MRKSISISIMALVLFTLFPSTTSAQEVSHDVTGAFKHPTTRVDNTQLNPNDIAGFNVYIDGNEYPLNSEETLPPTFGEYTLQPDSTSISFLATPGSHFFTITTIDTGGRESTKSFEVRFNVPVPPPVDPADPSPPEPYGTVIININIFPPDTGR